MKIYLVRHAKAEPRKQWRGADVLRPLCASGREQAQAVALHLGDAGLARIVSSPTLCCQQTLQPLTLASGIPVEVDERLVEGESVQRALELFPARNEGPVLFCTHGDLVVALLRLFELTDADIDEQIPCEKGSVWVLQGPGDTPTTARYAEPVRASTTDEAGPPQSVRVATLDLGSTSFNLLIAEATSAGEIRPVVREKFMLRLGNEIASNSEIPPRVRRRAVEAARELRLVIEQEKVQRLFPVATAAFRDARNGAALADRIGRSLETPVRILSGEEEARLMFKAFERRLGASGEPVLGLDLGGGSLELAVGQRGIVDLERTLRLGVVRLRGEFVGRDPMRKREARKIRKRVRALLRPHREAILERRVARTVATGGTIRALARVAAEKRASPGPRSSGPLDLSLASLREISAELVRSSQPERLAMRGMRKERSDLLAPGAIVLTTLAEELGIERLTVCDWGLREGVILDALENESGD